jgi:hypothetical protein
MGTTGLLQVDVEYDFLRARRRQFLATLGHLLRVRCRDGNRLVPLDEVVGPAGWRGERRLGRQTIRLDTIVGTAERRRDFDRRFRPTSHRVRFRWERLALAQRRGEAIPPIEVYRVCDRHFVIDGHHRVSIAAATGERQIEAYVTQVLAAVPCAPGRAPAHQGRRAEVLPTDPAGDARDDLVFRSGTMHAVSGLGDLLSINPRSCLFTGTVSGRALLVRNPDGSCSLTHVPRLEVDKFAGSGTLSF